MSSCDLAFGRALRLGAKVVAACVLALGLSSAASAEDIQFDWEIVPGDTLGTGDPDLQGTFLLNTSLRLGAGWMFGRIEIDQPANVLGESLDYNPARYGYTPLELASDGGYGGGILGVFSASPGTHAGLFDRVFLPDGSSRPSSIRISASYYGPDPAYDFGESRTWTYAIGVTLLESSGFPAIVPEPASIASATIAVVAVGGFLGRRRLQGARSDLIESA
ncbi:hypothetical protein [Paludisphaera soli]|uniref:hypothetical protein n=1 Tax=Paludisphaera soli TaxID=2712865 RepID=UPI0013E9D8FC|nr:hypothetical protein [Paludisphaera soli]